MNKLSAIALPGIGLLGVLMSASLIAAPQVAPFTDNLTINTTGFPAGTLVKYASDTDNQVNITGPSAIAPGDSSIMVHISSAHWSNGYPVLKISVPVSDITTVECRYKFIDGALVNALNYANGTPPACGGFQSSAVTKDDQYSYHMDVHFTA